MPIYPGTGVRLWVPWASSNLTLPYPSQYKIDRSCTAWLIFVLANLCSSRHLVLFDPIFRVLPQSVFFVTIASNGCLIILLSSIRCICLYHRSWLFSIFFFQWSPADFSCIFLKWTHFALRLKNLISVAVHLLFYQGQCLCTMH